MYVYVCVCVCMYLSPRLVICTHALFSGCCFSLDFRIYTMNPKNVQRTTKVNKDLQLLCKPKKVYIFHLRKRDN